MSEERRNCPRRYVAVFLLTWNDGASAVGLNDDKIVFGVGGSFGGVSGPPNSTGPNLLDRECEFHN